MSYPIEDKIVIAIASSALFDLSESDSVFKAEGGGRIQGVDVFAEGRTPRSGHGLSFHQALPCAE